MTGRFTGKRNILYIRSPLSEPVFLVACVFNNSDDGEIHRSQEYLILVLPSMICHFVHFDDFGVFTKEACWCDDGYHRRWG